MRSHYLFFFFITVNHHSFRRPFSNLCFGLSTFSHVCSNQVTLYELDTCEYMVGEIFEEYNKWSWPIFNLGQNWSEVPENIILLGKTLPRDTFVLITQPNKTKWMWFANLKKNYHNNKIPIILFILSVYLSNTIKVGFFI